MNKAIIKGRIGNDLVIENRCLNISVATSKKWKDKDGNIKDRTDWHRCKAFGKQAETIQKYFIKGSEILIEGEIQYSEYEGKNYTNIMVSNFEFCGAKIDPNRVPESNAHNEISEESEDALPF